MFLFCLSRYLHTYCKDSDHILEEFVGDLFFLIRKMKFLVRKKGWPTNYSRMLAEFYSQCEQDSDHTKQLTSSIFLSTTHVFTKNYSWIFMKFMNNHLILAEKRFKETNIHCGLWMMFQGKTFWKDPLKRPPRRVYRGMRVLSKTCFTWKDPSDPCKLISVNLSKGSFPATPWT